MALVICHNSVQLKSYVCQSDLAGFVGWSKITRKIFAALCRFSGIQSVFLLRFSEIQPVFLLRFSEIQPVFLLRFSEIQYVSLLRFSFSGD